MKADKWIGLMITAISGFMYYQAAILPNPPFYAGALGPDFFPRLVFAALGVLGVLLTILAVIGERKKNPTRTEPGSADTKIPGTDTSLSALFAQHKPVIVTTAIFIAYIVMMFYIGFIISTLIFLPTLMAYLGPRTIQSFKYIIIISAASGFGIYFIFVKMVKIFLPSGTLF